MRNLEIGHMPYHHTLGLLDIFIGHATIIWLRVIPQSSCVNSTRTGDQVEVFHKGP